MGGGTFDSRSYAKFSSSTVGKSTDAIFSSRRLHPTLNPHGVQLRESRDSADNPNSTPVIVALDVTGSMGVLADVIARKGLGTLFNNILDKKPITDPHVMFMGVGDVHFDSAPLQVSQFEADNRVVEQLALLYLEHGGGGNSSESYHLPWYFAAFHTEHDSMVKRGKKGYLFTVGDEEVPDPLLPSQAFSVCGDTIQAALSAQVLLNLAMRSYHVFHIIIEEGNHCRSNHQRVLNSWNSLMGQNALPLADHELLAETIVSTIEVVEGIDRNSSVDRWGARGSRIVGRAINDVSPNTKRLGSS